MDPKQEKELIEKAKKSLDAFDQLYEFYLPKIYGYLLNRTADKDLAEDITSQTFIKAMTKIKTYKDQGKTFGAWLYGIAHNNLIDYFRKHKAGTIFDMNQLESESSAERSAEQSETKLVVLKAMSDLPEQYQEILSLRFFEELSNEEIAEIIGSKKENVALKVHRSLKALQKILKKQGEVNNLFST